MNIYLSYFIVAHLVSTNIFGKYEYFLMVVKFIFVKCLTYDSWYFYLTKIFNDTWCYRNQIFVFRQNSFQLYLDSCVEKKKIINFFFFLMGWVYNSNCSGTFRSLIILKLKKKLNVKKSLPSISYIAFDGI